MTQRDFERKQRFGIRKFTVGAASVVIGAVVFGASPVLAQEAPATSGETAGQALPELPKEVESGNLANIDKELADKLAAATKEQKLTVRNYKQIQVLKNQQKLKLQQLKLIRQKKLRNKKLSLVIITQENWKMSTLS